MNEGQNTQARPAASWLWLLPSGAVLAWWVLDLQVQWRSMVEYQYGWLVLMLSAYLTWECWASRPKEDRPSSLKLCGALALVGMPLVLMAELVKNSMASSPTTSFILSIGCCLFLMANVLYLHGPATLKHFLFPLLFLFVAVPLPPSLWRPILLGLKMIITHLDVQALNLLGIPAVSMENVIQLPRCTVGVEDACSGIRSLQSSIMAGLFLGHIMLKRWSLRCVALLAGVGLALVGNFFRSLYLAVQAANHGPDAIKAAHDPAGWSILVFTTVGLMIFVWGLERLEKKAEAFEAR